MLWRCLSIPSQNMAIDNIMLSCTRCHITFVPSLGTKKSTQRRKTGQVTLKVSPRSLVGLFVNYLSTHLEVSKLFIYLFFTLGDCMFLSTSLVEKQTNQKNII